MSDPRLQDQAAFQEIDDAVRQDDLKAWWKRYGTYMVAGAVLVVVAATAVIGWQRYDTAQRSAAGQAYSVALAKIGQDNNAARADLEKQAQSAVEPYRSFAALAAAQLRPTAEEQVQALLDVAAKLPGELPDLAMTIAGFRSVDTPKAADTIAKLEPLAAPNRAFHVSVMELQALMAERKGDLKRARELWTEIGKDPMAPQGAVQRTQALLNFQDAQAADAKGAK